jgi:two-component system chemotaxis response regulator CheB
MELPIENLIVIGCSAGGHVALKELVQGFSENMPAAVIIMLHATAEGHATFQLPDWLRESSRMGIRLIESSDRLRGGHIYVVPPGMSVALKGRTLHLSPYDRGRGPVTTINLLFESAAHEFRDRVIGVILTGFLKDGTEGLATVHAAGGITIVQDPEDAEYPYMPASAMRDLPVTFCLKLADIGPALDLLARRKTELETGLAVSVRVLTERVGLLVRLIDQSRHNPETFQFLSTELVALRTALASLQGQLDVLSENAGSRSGKN